MVIFMTKIILKHNISNAKQVFAPKWRSGICGNKPPTPWWEMPTIDVVIEGVGGVSTVALCVPMSYGIGYPAFWRHSRTQDSRSKKVFYSDLDILKNCCIIRSRYLVWPCATILVGVFILGDRLTSSSLKIVQYSPIDSHTIKLWSTALEYCFSIASKMVTIVIYLIYIIYCYLYE